MLPHQLNQNLNKPLSIVYVTSQCIREKEFSSIMFVKNLCVIMHQE